MKAKTCIAAFVALIAGGVFASDLLPERILSGYYGYNVTRKGDHERNMHMIDVLAANGFNSYETKIQARGRHFDISPYVPKIKELSERARSKGLIFQIYLYTVPYLAIRNPELEEHGALPCPVGANGKPISNAFLLTDPAVWRQLFHHAFGFAAHQEEIGNATLKFDVERISEHVSFDDSTWADFCALNPGWSRSVAASERYKLLKSKKGGTAAYRKFFYSKVESAIAQFVKEIREIRPDIVLGYMPARPKGEMSAILNKVLSAPGIPAVADGWDMYNGSGYVDSVTQANIARVRAGNPNNRYVTWIRPDNYDPGDITVAAYHAGVKSDGYSIWTLAMLDETIPPVKRQYPLQKGCTIQNCLSAFSKANKAVRDDIAQGTLQSAGRIPFKAPAQRVAPLDLSKVRIPRLKAVCDNGVAAERSLVLRDQQTILMPRKAGEAISAKISHLSRRHYAALQYAVLDQSGRVLRNEAVTRLRTDKFEMPAPEEGTYALVVSGGNDGQAWYSVSVNGAWCLDARECVYLFEPQTIFVPGAKSGNGRFSVKMRNPQQEYVCRVADGAPVTNSFSAATRVFTLPDEKCVKVEFSRPAANSYSQDFMLGFDKDAANPFVFVDPSVSVQRLK